MKKLTFDEFQAILVEEEYDDRTLNLIQRWLARGDGVAVYENQDLGHPLLGMHVLVSWGGPEANLLKDAFPEPPKTLPFDNIEGVGLGWRYTLQGVYEQAANVSHPSGTVES